MTAAASESFSLIVPPADSERPRLNFSLRIRGAAPGSSGAEGRPRASRCRRPPSGRRAVDRAGVGRRARRLELVGAHVAAGLAVAVAVDRAEVAVVVLGGDRGDLGVAGVDRRRARPAGGSRRAGELRLADREGVDRAAVREVAVAEHVGAVEEPRVVDREVRVADRVRRRRLAPERVREAGDDRVADDHVDQPLPAAFWTSGLDRRVVRVVGGARDRHVADRRRARRRGRSTPRSRVAGVDAGDDAVLEARRRRRR